MKEPNGEKNLAKALLHQTIGALEIDYFPNLMSISKKFNYCVLSLYKFSIETKKKGREKIEKKKLKVEM